MKVVAAILAAGSGARFGGDKTAAVLGGRPVWRWSYDAYAAHPLVQRTVLVGSEANLEALSESGREAILGGATRQESAHRALDAAEDADILLVHDAARPFVSADLITAVIHAVEASGAAAAALPVTDTIKRLENGRVTTLDRKVLVAMQTPQGAHVPLLREAHARATGDHTDEMALLEAAGTHPTIVPGEPNNFKITLPEDLARARALVGGGEQRTGFGYDVHPFSEDSSRTLMLGGVAFPNHPALDGHSDADVLLHAVTDALLGAAAMGDIGVHFPNTDERWRGAPSLTFLRHAGTLLQEAGWNIVNVDATVVAESPKIMKRADEIRTAIAGALRIDLGRVSVKATTNERLGFVGRGEGIAALATAAIRRD